MLSVRELSFSTFLYFIYRVLYLYTRAPGGLFVVSFVSLLLATFGRLLYWIE